MDPKPRCSVMSALDTKRMRRAQRTAGCTASPIWTHTGSACQSAGSNTWGAHRPRKAAPCPKPFYATVLAPPTQQWTIYQAGDGHSHCNPCSATRQSTLALAGKGNEHRLADPGARASGLRLGASGHGRGLLGGAGLNDIHARGHVLARLQRHVAALDEALRRQGMHLRHTTERAAALQLSSSCALTLQHANCRSTAAGTAPRTLQHGTLGLESAAHTGPLHKWRK